MKKVFLLFFCPLFVPAAMVMSAQGGDKTTICHTPPDDPTNPHTITVSNTALDTHLAHGDYRGECDGCKSDGVPCENPSLFSSECCNGICSGEGICASDCTYDADKGDPADDCSFERPCCPETMGMTGGGVCIYEGACHPGGETCALLGQNCNDFDGPQCCFGNGCVPFDVSVSYDGVCTAL